jgi:hypothetical protein
MLEAAQKAEKRAHDLEKLGITPEAMKAEIEIPSVLPKIVAGGHVPPPDPAPSPAAPPTQASASPQDSLYPAATSIKEMPLLESSEEVVQALALLDHYWKTETWQERVPLVAHAENVAALMKDYYETQKGTDPMPGGLISKARYEIDGSEILYFSYTSNRPTGSLEVAMLRGPQGKFLLDWESLTGYGEKSFQDFRTQRPSKPVLIRAYVRLFDFYSYEFSDSKKYLCIKLMSENGESSIYAYCERGTKLAGWIDADLASTGPIGFKGYTMLISFPPNAQSNQCVNLDKVVAQRWLRLP